MFCLKHLHCSPFYHKKILKLFVKLFGLILDCSNNWLLNVLCNYSLRGVAAFHVKSYVDYLINWKRERVTLWHLEQIQELVETSFLGCQFLLPTPELRYTLKIISRLLFLVTRNINNNYGR